MKPLFADTSGLVAYLNPDDEHHGAAVEYLESYLGRIVTTTWVLAELGNFLARGPQRQLFGPFVGTLRNERQFTLIPASEEMFERVADLYRRRPDKQWSLTDCASFLAMQDHKIREALTADHHFEQAGFRAVLK